MARRAVVWMLAMATVAAGACGGGGQSHPDGGAVGSQGCSDLFGQDSVRTYSLEIDPAEWQSLEAEFNNLAELSVNGNAFATYHPVVFRLDQETVTNAAIKLHGQSSWLETVMFDGARAKMQFTVALSSAQHCSNRICSPAFGSPKRAGGGASAVVVLPAM